MIVGILHEGEYDYDPLKEITEKIFAWRFPSKNIIPTFVGRCADGPTPPKFQSACTYFLDPSLSRLVPNLIIFHSDLDSDPDAKQNCIRLRDEYKRNNPDIYITLALPNPHLEQWFISEVDSLINYFNFFDGNLPNIPSKSPKHYLKNIINRFGDITLKNQEIYQKIAHEMDIKKLYARDPNFKYFVDDFINIYNAYESGI